LAVEDKQTAYKKKKGKKWANEKLGGKGILGLRNHLRENFIERVGAVNLVRED